MTAIKACVCAHAWQDARYGKGKRVHNSVDKTRDPQVWRCTVCAKECT